MEKEVRSILRVFVFMAMTAVMSCAIRSMPEYEKNPTLPQVSGTIQAPGLHGEVKIYRDNWGVPHIFTEDKHDLFFADGYVQAQDRLWEMVLFRAIATGRLSEIFGNIGVPGQSAMGFQISTLEMDKYQRTMGMNYIGLVDEVLLAKVQPETLAMMQAFCDGVNAFLKQNRERLPIEFQVLYYEPEPFRPADIISLSRFYGSVLCANLDKELLRYAIAKKYGEETAWKLAPLHDLLGPTVVPKEMLKNRLNAPRPLHPSQKIEGPVSAFSAEQAFMFAEHMQAFRAAAGFPSYQASNNWVVGPKVTATKTAMLANDPHLFHIEPSLCYVMHLKGAGYDAYGVVFPGQPFIVMGHTRRLSWGATVTNADVQDLFVETVDKAHPGKYLYKGEWRDFTVRREMIRVRPGLIQTGPDKRFREKVIEVRSSIHGPIMNGALADLPKDTPPLALRWTGYDFSRDPKMFETFINASSVEDFKNKIDQIDFSKIETINVAQMFDLLMKGRGIDDFVTGMARNELINMNWVAADADGHIAYLPGGLVPIRKKGIGVMPVPGESGEYDWEGFIPLMETPHAIDPARGWMATANNQVVDMEWYPYVFGTNYSEGWRAWRIEELIEQLKPIDINDMRRIQNDVYVKEAELFVPRILKAIEVKGVKDKQVLKAARILREWNLEASIDSPAPSIFFETMGNLKKVVLKDEFPARFYDKYISGVPSSVVGMWVLQGQSEYLDNKKTRGKVENADDALVASLKDALKSLRKVLGSDMQNWQWGKIHTIKWYHPMGFMALKDMSIGPFPHPGGGNTVRNAEGVGFGSRKYMTFGGPVMRHIMDMGDPDNALLVIDGSQSGQWLSPHYRDMHTLWYNSEYMTAEMRPEKIAAAAESLLTLKPEK